MKILVINPNSTASMTQKIEACATESVSNSCLVHTVSPSVATPASIEGNYDAAMSMVGVLGEVQKGEKEGYDGYVIACFDDVGVDACREIAAGPVLGICEAGLHAASVIASRFSIITTLPRAISHIEELVFKYGFERKCGKVRAVDLPVLDLEHNQNARYELRDAIKQAATEDNCEAVILGCAGMTDLAAWLQAETHIPTIDGLKAAMSMIEALVRAGFKTSKVCTYAKPREK